MKESVPVNVNCHSAHNLPHIVTFFFFVPSFRFILFNFHLYFSFSPSRFFFHSILLSLFLFLPPVYYFSSVRLPLICRPIQKSLGGVRLLHDPSQPPGVVQKERRLSVDSPMAVETVDSIQS